MKLNRNKISIFFSIILCVCSLCGCGVKETEASTVRVAAMKGPTTIGLLHFMDKSKTDDFHNTYEFQMMTAADEILPLIIKEELDIALLPANVASILYQKTNGGICVIDINTLGVLYLVSGDESITTMEDLKGKTIYLTGKGTTPDYVLQYLLKANKIAEEDYTLEYKSEATEVAALLKEKPDAVGLLPQPFATVACASNEELSMVMDLNEQWKLLWGENGNSQVTGVTVVRKAFLQDNEEAVWEFMEAHKESSQKAVDELDKTALLCVEAGILPKEGIAKAAIPKCNITYIEKEEMQKALSSYLEVLYEENPEFIGGKLPGEDFYYVR